MRSLYFLGKLGIFLLLLSGTFTSCIRSSKKLNRRITLWRKDDIPYGTRLAYEGLPHLFPGVEVSVNKKSPVDLSSNSGTNKAYIILVDNLDPRPSEVTALLNFVGEGNHIFISTHHVADTLLHALGLKASWGTMQGAEPDSLRLKLYDPDTETFRSFSYPGDSYDSWFTSLDTQYATVMGKDGRGRPDFVKFTYKGGGSLYLQLAPLAFSNFFLLHKDNRVYYEKAISNLPSKASEVLWDDYYRYSHNEDFSAFQYILSNKSLRWAFWLMLVLFALIYLFDSKRRQRMIPLISPLRNTSVDFVRTIGRLYFQRRDNHNLAMKMVAHFQDQVRTRYQMASPTMDGEFIDRLSYRTGYPKEQLSRLVGYMQMLPSKAYVPDQELLEFHQQLDEFYKTV